VLGLAWGLILPEDYGWIVAILLGIGLGYVAGETVSWATNRKSATVLQVMAGAALVAALLIRNLLWVEELLPGDFYGYLVTIVGIFAAAGRFRF
jgi:hypothetical protein